MNDEAFKRASVIRQELGELERVIKEYEARVAIPSAKMRQEYWTRVAPSYDAWYQASNILLKDFYQQRNDLQTEFDKL